jgi:uncharacterized protein DUF4410/uncharacterized protein DUF3313
MIRWANVRWCGLGIALSVMLTGCGATRSSADNPTSFGGLTPNTPDMEAGLVAIAPAFDVRTYRAVVVEPFPVTDSEIQDEGDRRFAVKMTHYFHMELLRRLRETGLFQQVSSATDTAAKAADGPTLRLRGVVTRLGRGSQAARYFAGLYGAGRTRAQADMQLVDAASGKVGLVTADRRVASMGWFGGSDEEHLEESFNDLARDFARFLVRLSQGQAPKAAP